MQVYDGLHMDMMDYTSTYECTWFSAHAAVHCQGALLNVLALSQLNEAEAPAGCAGQ